MRPSYVSVLSLATQSLAAPVDDAEESVAGQETPAGVLQLPLVPIPSIPQDSGTSLSRRQAQDDLEVYKFLGRRPVVGFGMPLEIGTPPQTVIVEPDTGSDTLWVPNVRAGKAREEPASVYFDQARSTSRRDLKKPYGAAYNARERVVFNMNADVMSMRGRSLGEIQFGVADVEKPPTSLGRDVGILGLKEPKPNNPYAKESIVQKMLDKKIITHRSFSMNVNEQGKGAITFGGYDTKRFSGPLEKFPFSSQTSDHFMFNMKSVSLSAGTTANQVIQDQGLTIGLDSGSPSLALKPEAFDKIKTSLGATVTQNVLIPDCSKLQDTNMILALSDKLSITLPFKDLEADEPKLKTPGKCPVAIVRSTGNIPADVWIGGHFLRRAYVVFDLAGKNVYVARSGDCGSNLVAINGAIPAGVVGDCAEEPLGPVATPPDAPADKPSP